MFRAIFFGLCSIASEVSHIRAETGTRMLLSHTSGLAYDFTTPASQKYVSFVGEESGFQEPLSGYVLGPLVSLWHECSAWRYAVVI